MRVRYVRSANQSVVGQALPDPAEVRVGHFAPGGCGRPLAGRQQHLATTGGIQEREVAAGASVQQWQQAHERGLLRL